MFVYCNLFLLIFIVFIVFISHNTFVILPWESFVGAFTPARGHSGCEAENPNCTIGGVPPHNCSCETDGRVEHSGQGVTLDPRVNPREGLRGRVIMESESEDEEDFQDSKESPPPVGQGRPPQPQVQFQ